VLLLKFYTCLLQECTQFLFKRQRAVVLGLQPSAETEAVRRSLLEGT